MHIRRCPKTGTDGKSSSANAWADIFLKFMAFRGAGGGGREKAPAAICRKVLEARISGKHEIEIWGDGHQTRSFMYVDDCTQGVVDIYQSDFVEPINLE